MLPHDWKFMDEGDSDEFMRPDKPIGINVTPELM